MDLKRRDFLRSGAAAAAVLPLAGAPTVHVRRTVDPVVISDTSGIRFRNGGSESAVERAFRGSPDA